MAESNTNSEKARAKSVQKKAVPKRKSTAKKITLKNFDDDQPSLKKAAPKRIKKPVKKTPVKAPLKPPEKVTNEKPDNLETVKSLVHEMRREHNKRDQQITAMVREISQGFSDYAKQGDEREQRSLEMIKTLTDAIKMGHLDNRQDVDQKEQQSNHIQPITGRNRIIAISGAVIGFFAIITFLYVVNMLGTAMTTISADIHKIQLSVGGISTRIDSMSLDTHSMSGNIQQLNRNVTNMSKDLSVLSNNVAPRMRGMRNTTPWAP